MSIKTVYGDGDVVIKDIKCPYCKEVHTYTESVRSLSIWEETRGGYNYGMYINTTVKCPSCKKSFEIEL